MFDAFCYGIFDSQFQPATSGEEAFEESGPEEFKVFEKKKNQEISFIFI